METQTQDETISELAVYTVEELRGILSLTEEVEEFPFSYGPGLQVSVEYAPEEPADKLFLRVGDVRAPFTRDAAERMFKEVNLTPKLLEAVPLEITTPLLNWWLSNEEGAMKALMYQGKVSAFCSVSNTLDSAVDLFDALVGALKDKYGIDDIIVLNPFHDLNNTQFTLVFPQRSTMLDNGDVLLQGIHFQNSLLAKEPLVMFNAVVRDYHMNGMVSQESVEKWDRRLSKTVTLEEAARGESSYDVYDWIGEAVANIVKSSKNDVVSVKRLQGIEVGSHSGTFLQDVFTKYSIPAALRGMVREAYVDQPDETIYDLWNAITHAANREEVRHDLKKIRKLMVAGGAIAAHPESCPSCHRLKDELE